MVWYLQFCRTNISISVQHLFLSCKVELQLERGKLPLAEYAVKEAKLLAYKLVADYEQLAEEGAYLKLSLVQNTD